VFAVVDDRQLENRQYADAERRRNRCHAITTDVITLKSQAITSNSL